MEYEEASELKVKIEERTVRSEGGGSYDYVEVEFPDGLPPGAKVMMTGNGPDLEDGFDANEGRQEFQTKEG